ncbi:MAG TPA: methylated-DNA--[protein]-cysteine S-methyltransferase [Arenimonas sp.]|uniref:methylated-DNA--[protein]-cysteine S-methyltransferase n=1 Tax=Arenimonas sp. TaxID=1872635 RepID=UPI002CCC396A|nr:methylated-DNA--[protein]-cysteine S-methyltransferase [Arenimonas sp.]HMB57684.1 methylated-DNA--[protein]-cysteine S-methyltransferase [Arenimonas sp.]
MTTTTHDPRLEQARRLLDHDDVGLDALGAAVGLSPGHLQRRFRAAFGLSPAEYRAQKKLALLKQELRASGDVTRALYEAGYGSPSRIYEDGGARLGMLPGAYRRGGEGMTIHWSLIDTVIGLALVAATERGLCAIALGDDEKKLEAELRGEFPRADIVRVQAGRDDFLAPRVRAVADLLAGKRGQVPVELIGTAFQQRVWEALMKIPRGQTFSYAELAKQIDRPGAARAVARACAQNRLAVLVPCHRIIRGDGSLGGYRWGLPRKDALLRAESGKAAQQRG